MAEMFQRFVASLTGSGQQRWEQAKQMAAAIANEGEPAPNVDPADRVAFEQLQRVAELHVAQLTGLTPAGTIMPSSTTSVRSSESNPIAASAVSGRNGSNARTAVLRHIAASNIVQGEYGRLRSLRHESDLARCSVYTSRRESTTNCLPPSLNTHTA